MARFLSAAWLDELGAAVADVRLPPGSAAVTIAQIVHADASDDVVAEYRIRVDDASAAVERAGDEEASEPDVTLLLDLTTAAQIARGLTNTQQALAAGRCRLRGHPERLAVVATSMRAVRGSLQHLAATTEYPR